MFIIKKIKHEEGKVFIRFKRSKASNAYNLILKYLFSTP